MLNKFFGFFRKSDDELRKEFVVREIDNNDEVPAYEDSNVALYEEVRQVANIKHACELDAECIDCLEDYDDLIVNLLAFADVRKFTIFEDASNNTIILRKDGNKVGFIPDDSDYIDDEALLEALNRFLKLCGARGRIYSLWEPDLGQGLVFFYTEDVDAVEKYISENLQEDDNVSFEDMKGEINSYVD